MKIIRKSFVSSYEEYNLLTHVTLIYINANLLYGECLKLLSKHSWKRTIRTGIVKALLEKHYTFTTSILTRMEIMQRLIREENCSVLQARRRYDDVCEKFSISQISSLNKHNLLTNDFIDVIAKSNLDFKDALHLAIASKHKLIVVTHDKKF